MRSFVRHDDASFGPVILWSNESISSISSAISVLGDHKKHDLTRRTS